MNMNTSPYSGYSYNQAINRVYFNPYSMQSYGLSPRSHNNNNNNNTNEQNHNSFSKKNNNNLSRSQFPSAKDFCRPSDSPDGDSQQAEEQFKSLMRIRENADEYYRKGYIGSKANKMSSSQFVNSGNQFQEDQKPAVNYFVTEFQRLQQQNKKLRNKIQQQESKGSSRQSTPPNGNQIDLLYQNQQLKKELQQQKRKNLQKNEKISHLMDKITQIEEHVQIMAKTKSQSIINAQNQLKNRQYQLLQEKQIVEREIAEIKHRYAEVINSRFNEFIFKIQELEGQLQQQRTKYKQLQQKVQKITYIPKPN